MVIWKFALKITDIQEITIPDGARLLSVDKQGYQLCLWAMVDQSKECRRRFIEIIGTGNPIPQEAGIERKFIGTVVIDSFVWHVFERL